MAVKILTGSKADADRPATTLPNERNFAPRNAPIDLAHELALSMNDSMKRRQVTLDRCNGREQLLSHAFKRLGDEGVTIRGNLIPMAEGLSRSVFLIKPEMLPNSLRLSDHPIVFKVRSIDPERRHLSDPLREVAVSRFARLTDIPELVPYSEFGSLCAKFVACDVSGTPFKDGLLRVQGVLQEYIPGHKLSELNSERQRFPRVLRAFDYVIGDIDRSIVNHFDNAILEQDTGLTRAVDFGLAHNSKFGEYFDSEIYSQNPRFLEEIVADFDTAIPTIDPDVELFLEACLVLGEDGFKIPFSNVPARFMQGETIDRLEFYACDSFQRAVELYEVLNKVKSRIEEIGI